MLKTFKNVLQMDFLVISTPHRDTSSGIYVVKTFSMLTILIKHSVHREYPKLSSRATIVNHTWLHAASGVNIYCVLLFSHLLVNRHHYQSDCNYAIFWNFKNPDSKIFCIFLAVAKSTQWNSPFLRYWITTKIL